MNSLLADAVATLLRAPGAWTVDPLAGTKNFAKGDGRYCSMIALVEHGVPLLPAGSGCF